MTTLTHSTDTHHYYTCDFGGHPIRMRRPVHGTEMELFIDDIAKALGYNDKDDFMLNDCDSLSILLDVSEAVNQTPCPN